MYRSLLIGLSVLNITPHLFAQAPPNLTDSLHIIGIRKWNVVKTTEAYLEDHPQGVAMLAGVMSKYPTRSPDNAYYVIKMEIAIENNSESTILFKDPWLNVSLVQPEESGVKTGVSEDGKVTYDPNHVHKAEVVVNLGKARLTNPNRTETWQPIATIFGTSSGSPRSKETPIAFEIVVGAQDLENAGRMINAFNIMNEQGRQWQLLIRGSAKVGYRGSSSGESVPMMFAALPTDFDLTSKPMLPSEITFPK